MKTVSTDLSNYMNSEKHFQTCDLYKLVLTNGTTYYIADSDTDVAYDGHTWEHNRGLYSRDQIKLTGEPTVDTLTINIACSRADFIGSVPILQACHDGVLSGATMTLYKVYFSEGVAVGGVRLFQGFCEVSQAGGLKVKLTCKSYVQGLSQNVPVRIFAPQAAYANVDGTVTSSDSDTTTMLIPLKPSQRVLVKL